MRKAKKLEIRNQRFVGVRKLLARESPYTIITHETYSPFRESKRDLRSSLRRVARRKKTITLDAPATHEIHLATKSVETSQSAMENPAYGVATFFTIHGPVRELLERRPGTTALIYGPDGDERLYYVLAWDDVMYNPMKEAFNGEDYTQTRRKIARCRLPLQKFGRQDDGAKVYYLFHSTQEQFRLVKEALGCVEERTTKE